jgi:hypothetical protein
MRLVIAFPSGKAKHVVITASETTLVHEAVILASRTYARFKDLPDYDYEFLVDGQKRNEYEPLGDLTKVTTLKVITKMPEPAGLS